jgi:hypothetical protein
MLHAQACQHWSIRNRMQINTEKTKIMAFFETPALLRARGGQHQPSPTTPPFHVYSPFPTSDPRSYPIIEVSDQLRHLQVAKQGEIRRARKKNHTKRVHNIQRRTTVRWALSLMRSMQPYSKTHTAKRLETQVSFNFIWATCGSPGSLETAT